VVHLQIRRVRRWKQKSFCCICSEHWDSWRHASYYPQSSLQRGTKPDPHLLFNAFSLGATFFQGGSNPPNPRYFFPAKRIKTVETIRWYSAVDTATDYNIQQNSVRTASLSCISTYLLMNLKVSMFWEEFRDIITVNGDFFVNGK